MGIIQPLPKEKKRWDKEDPAEIRARRKAQALARGEEWSDSYGSETEGGDDASGIDDYGRSRHGTDETVQADLLGGKSGKSMMHNVQMARNKVLGKGMHDEREVELPCPDGYDPLKWMTLSRAEKMKILGISEAEWNKMTRE